MAEISLVGNLFKSVGPTEKSEGTVEGIAQTQLAGGVSAGSSFSPILAQFIAALLRGKETRHPAVVTGPQQFPNSPELCPTPEIQAPQMILSEELARVANSMLGPAALMLSAAQVENLQGTGTSRTPGEETQNPTLSTSPDMAALVKAALGKKTGLLKEADTAAASKDEQSGTTSDEAPAARQVESSDVPGLESAPGEVAASIASLPVGPTNDPSQQGSEKSSAQKLGAVQVQDTQAADTIRPETGIDLTVALAVSEQGVGAAESTAAMQQVPVFLSASPKDQRIDTESAGATANIPASSREGVRDSIQPIPGRNSSSSMTKAEAANQASQEPDAGQRGEAAQPGDSDSNVIAPENRAGGNGFDAVETPVILKMGLAANRKVIRELSAEPKIQANVEPRVGEKTTFGSAGSARHQDMISKLATLPVDKVVVMKNEAAKTPAGATLTSASKETTTAQPLMSSPASPQNGNQAELPNGTASVTTAHVHPHTSDRRNIEEASSFSSIPANAGPLRGTTEKESRTGSHEQDSDTRRTAFSVKAEGETIGTAKEIADPRIVATQASSATREMADAIKQQTVSIAPKVESRQDVQHAPQVKPLPLPGELMSNVHEQIAKEVALRIAGNVSEIKVTLKPESLGSVIVHVRMEEGSMVARIDANQPAVRTALESNLPQLRDNLVSKGIQVDRIDVMTSSFSSSRESNNQQRERGKAGLKRSEEMDAVESYEAGRFLGYNTMDYLV